MRRWIARGRRLAAVLACGPGAVISHRTAANALGLLRRASAAIEVSIPCTTVARTLLDLAAVEDARTLARAIEAAERLRIFDGAAVERLLARNRGHPGVARLRAALVAYTEPPPTREEFERLAFEVLAQTSHGRPLANVLIDTAQEQLEVDFCWPDRRLIVEADSWDFHKTRAAFERDRKRDLLLRAAGWTAIRITWRQLRQAPHEVIAAIA